MTLEFILLADDVDVDASGKVDIRGGGIGRIGVPHLPATVAKLASVARLLIAPTDLGRIHEITMTLHAPSGNPLVRTTGFIDLRATPTSIFETGVEPGVVLNVELGPITFEQPGVHHLQYDIERADLEPLRFGVTFVVIAEAAAADAAAADA